MIFKQHRGVQNELNKSFIINDILKNIVLGCCDMPVKGVAVL